MQCFECKNEIGDGDFKTAVCIADVPPISFLFKTNFGPFAPINHRYYHGNCRVKSEKRLELLELSRDNAMLAHLLDLAKSQSWTWKETLEYALIYFVKENAQIKESFENLLKCSATPQTQINYFS